MDNILESRIGSVKDEDVYQSDSDHESPCGLHNQARAYKVGLTRNRLICSSIGTRGHRGD